jgi:hypothetical protein
MQISNEAMRGAEKLPPLRPNIDLAKLAPIVAGNIKPESGARAINLAIADWVVQYKVSVWARYENMPIKLIHEADLKNAIFDYKQGTLKYANDWHSLTFSDVKFNKTEVDAYWL